MLEPRLEHEQTSRSPAERALIGLWASALLQYAIDARSAWQGIPTTAAAGDHGEALDDLLGSRRELRWLCSFLDLNPAAVAAGLLRQLRATGDRQSIQPRAPRKSRSRAEDLDGGTA